MSGLNEDFMMAGTQSHADDARLFVTFSFEPRLDRRATDEAGRNVYRDVEFVTIKIPGDKLVSIHRPISASDKQRFPHQYAAFKNRAGEQVVGTPLTLWPGVRPAQIKELEFFNIRTVEQLASMPDSGAGQMMGLATLKRTAQQYVGNAKDQAPLLAVQKELVARDSTIAAQAAQISDLSDKFDKLIANLSATPEAKPPKGK